MWVNWYWKSSKVFGTTRDLRIKTRRNEVATTRFARRRQNDFDEIAWIFFLNSKSRIIGNGAAAADLKVVSYSVTCLHAFRSYSQAELRGSLKFLCQSAKMEIAELKNARNQLNAFVETLRDESSPRKPFRGVTEAPLTDDGVLVHYLRKNVTSLSREYANVRGISYSLLPLNLTNTQTQVHLRLCGKSMRCSFELCNLNCTPAKTRPKWIVLTPLRTIWVFMLTTTINPIVTTSKRLNLGPAAKRQRTMSGDDLTRMLMQTPVSAAVKALESGLHKSWLSYQNNLQIIWNDSFACEQNWVTWSWI